MVNYQLGKIYKIVDNTNGNVYIGSTCEPTLARRLAGHVGNYKKYLNGKYHYVTSFNILENNNYDMVLIEKYPCESKEELHKRERYYIESIECINKYIPNNMTNGKQEYQKEYKKNNKDQLYLKAKQPYTCSCDHIIRISDKARHLKTKKHINYMSNL
mmetsp:Transcript_24261/g.24874  ORF Transcript_24261/g.24874 Transcript_24261/m.24874 type:complete len:158 (+) Transcript_24261:133-606(+)